ncbi:MAG: porin family protein [Bacteroidales bacterium]|nr:porin family protein [Bacteroidales bacterium]
MISLRLKSVLTSGFRTLAAAVVLCTGFAASAQTAPYKFDFGVDLGMSGYIGDANGSNIFKRPGFDGDLSFRYNGDTRWAIRGMFSTFGLSGSTEGMANVLPDQAVYTFSSQIYELSARGEFNFFAYGIGETYKRLKRWSPYLTVGIGAALASSGGNTYVAPTIPMGLGIKYKLSERWNLGVEFTMTKAFNDHFDGADLADLNLIKTAFYKNTDWYSRLTIGISYEFGKRCETCHYVD